MIPGAGWAWDSYPEITRLPFTAPLLITALHCFALHCTALLCTTLHCTALHCTELHCTTLNRAEGDAGTEGKNIGKKLTIHQSNYSGASLAAVPSIYSIREKYLLGDGGFSIYKVLQQSLKMSQPPNKIIAGIN